MINIPVAKFVSPPLFEGGDTIAVELTEVGGFFALSVTGGFQDEYLTLQKHQYREILNLYEDAPKPSGRTPFSSAEVPPYGWALFGYLIEVYAYEKDHIKLISSTCEIMATFNNINVPHYHAQATISVATFREIAEAVDNYCCS